MKCIGKLKVGEYISLQYVCNYVAKYTEDASTSVFCTTYMESSGY